MGENCLSLVVAGLLANISWSSPIQNSAAITFVVFAGTIVGLFCEHRTTVTRAVVLIGDVSQWVAEEWCHVLPLSHHYLRPSHHHHMGIYIGVLLLTICSLVIFDGTSACLWLLMLTDLHLPLHHHGSPTKPAAYVGSISGIAETAATKYSSIGAVGACNKEKK